MRILPKTASGRIAFAQAHHPAWAADPAAIGLTAPQVAEIAGLAELAEEARLAANVARERARSATLAAAEAAEELRIALSRAVAGIKVAAQWAADPDEVFIAARIPEAASPPTDPARLAPPAINNASVSVNARGEASIAWTTGAGGARGARLGRQRRARADVQYVVVRAGAEGGAGEGEGREDGEILGTTNAPRFIDARPLPGRSIYTIRALRGRRVGAWTASVVLELPVMAGKGMKGGAGMGGAGVRMGGAG